MEGTTLYMEGIGLKVSPVVVRQLVDHLSMFGPIADTSWTYS